MNILSVENHPVFAEQATRQFLSTHTVFILPSLLAARKEFAKGSYDLILCDYDLDDGKGDDFVRECRAAFPELPIIAVSSHGAGNAALLRAGASAGCGKWSSTKLSE